MAWKVISSGTIENDRNGNTDTHIWIYIMCCTSAIEWKWTRSGWLVVNGYGSSGGAGVGSSQVPLESGNERSDVVDDDVAVVLLARSTTVVEGFLGHSILYPVGPFLVGTVPFFCNCSIHPRQHRSNHDDSEFFLLCGLNTGLVALLYVYKVWV